MSKPRWQTLIGSSAIAIACASLASGPSYAASAVAQEAKVVPVQGTATLRVVHESGNIHEAEGRAVGTLGGTLRLRIDIESASRMTASFVDHLHGGTISGSGSARYTISGANLKFTGTTNVSHGTGPYAGASGSGIRLEGLLDRLTKSIKMTIHGSMQVK
jgi:hypothetical protein